jgi:hypothetical protein
VRDDAERKLQVAEDTKAAAEAYSAKVRREADDYAAGVRKDADDQRARSRITALSGAKPTIHARATESLSSKLPVATIDQSHGRSCGSPALRL